MKKPLREELPIEPLSDRAWARIEQGLFEGAAGAARIGASPPAALAQAVPSRRAVRVAAAAAVVAALAASLAAVVVWQGRSEPLPSAESFVVTRESGTEVAVSGASLAIGPHSALFVRGSATEGMLILLDRGSVRCDVEARRGRSPFTVRAGDVTVSVVGTRFTVRRVGAEVEVAVDRGVVDVVAPGQSARLRAGGRWRTAAAVAAAHVPSAMTANEPVALPASAAPPGPSDRRTRPSAPARDAAPPPRAARSVTPADERAVPTRPGPLASPPGSTAPGVEHAEDAQREYESSARLEARDPEAAARRYEDLSRGEGPWAATALFARARLAAERGQRELAVRLLRQYLARHPDGPNAPDARVLLSRLSP